MCPPKSRETEIPHNGATLHFSSCQSIMGMPANPPSSVSVHCKPKFLLDQYFSLDVKKIIPLLYTFSFCHQGCQMYCVLWPRQTSSVTNWSQPVLSEKKEKKLFISLLFGPCHKDCFRPKRSTRCFLAELQNVLWEAGECSFLFMNWSMLEDQSWGTGPRMKKFPVSVQDFKKYFSTYNQSCV